MPTNHDETLHERYAREHQAQMETYARMTPEQISDMATELHNALARIADLESQQAASVGGEREAGAEWIERHYGFPASQLCLLNGKDLERAFSGGWQARAALSPAGGGVDKLPDMNELSNVIRSIVGWSSMGAGRLAEAICDRLNAKPKPVKCDGNHGGPRCADPECWNDDKPQPNSQEGEE